MRGARIIACAAIAILFLGALCPLFSTGGAMTPYQKGHTALHGYTDTNDSSFTFHLSGDYWYEDVTLIMETWNDSSDYMITLDGEVIENGTFQAPSKSTEIHVNPGVHDLKVEIDGYSYTFERKLVSQDSVESGWNPSDQDGEEVTISEVELTMKELRVFAGSIFFVLISVPVAGRFAKKRMNRTIYKIIGD